MSVKSAEKISDQVFNPSYTSFSSLPIVRNGCMKMIFNMKKGSYKVVIRADRNNYIEPKDGDIIVDGESFSDFLEK